MFSKKRNDKNVKALITSRYKLVHTVCTSMCDKMAFCQYLSKFTHSKNKTLIYFIAKNKNQQKTKSFVLIIVLMLRSSIFNSKL